MEYAHPERIRELKLTAKWSPDSNEKKQAIIQLLQCGNEALPAIREVLAITAFDDVKQACIKAISSLGRRQKDKDPDNIKTDSVNGVKKSKRKVAKRTKNQRKKRKQAKK